VITNPGKNISCEKDGRVKMIPNRIKAVLNAAFLICGFLKVIVTDKFKLVFIIFKKKLGHPLSGMAGLLAANPFRNSPNNA
jgi:hypothetical protein